MKGLQEEINKLADMLQPTARRDEYAVFQQIGKILEMMAWKLGEYTEFDGWDAST